ncbi:MAG TPA: WYL domain-containing protein [Hanamia sp.]|nr:WYL domain-containing protein [Hanamia sp.]
MAITKMPLIRYKVLDKCFRNPGKKYFIDDLIKEVSKVLVEMDSASNGISRRQILTDIEFMESSEGWNVDLTRTYDGKRIFYRYADTSFSINNMPLNEAEITQIESAIKVLSHFKGMPQFEMMHELLPKLQEGISVNEQSKPVMSFDANQYLKGIENLGELFNAITYKKALLITYQDFKSKSPYQIILHPYYLKQYNNRWFLFGYNPEKEKYDWNLALDRIVEINEKKEKYHANDHIDWDEYFEDIIGVTKPEGKTAEKITLQFNGDTCKYIESKPLHGSQKSKWTGDKTLIVALELIVNFELERMILSYGENVKVISPQHLSTTIKNKLVRSLKQYDI